MMNIYDGSSQTAFGKKAGVVSRPKKRKSRQKRIDAERASNAVTRTGTSAVSKGYTTFGMTNSGNGLIRNANSQALTTNSGLSPYDGFGIIAAGGDPVVYMQISCGSDFASASAAFAGKKNTKCTLTIDGVDYVGVLDPDSKAARGYKVVFPQLTSLFSVSAGTSTGFKIEFTT